MIRFPENADNTAVDSTAVSIPLKEILNGGPNFDKWFSGVVERNPDFIPTIKAILNGDNTRGQ